jgi:CrcB protein
VSRILLVAVGGALGSVARYLVGAWAAATWSAPVPVGTAIVNLVGSWFIALVVELSLRSGLLTPEVTLFLVTGVAGGFTTYSAFNQEALQLFQGRGPLLAVAYVAGMLLLCLLAGILGVATARLAGGALAALLGGGR